MILQGALGAPHKEHLQNTKEGAAKKRLKNRISQNTTATRKSISSGKKILALGIALAITITIDIAIVIVSGPLLLILT